MRLLTVIIPSYNRAAILDATLASLARQTRTDFAVIVVDHGSTDQTAEIAQKYAGTLPLTYYKIARDGRHFAGVPRDFGVRQAETPLILFADSGTVMPSWYVDAHITFHQQHPNHIGIGFQHGQDMELLAPNNASEERAISALKGIDVDHAYEVLKAAHLLDVREDMGLEQSSVPWLFGWTANLSLARSAYHAAGGFDLELEGWGFEDVDLSYRLFKQGATFALVKDGWGIELPQARKSANERFQSNLTNAMHCYTKQRSLALEALLLSSRFIASANNEAIKASYASPAGSNQPAYPPFETMLTSISNRFNQYTDEIYRYLSALKREKREPVPAPANLPTELHGPTLLIGGSLEDSEQYDYVTIGDEDFPSTTAAWSCWGSCIPLPDESLGTVVVSDIWKQLAWSPQLPFGLPTVPLLDYLITEIRRTAQHAVFLHTPAIHAEEVDTLLPVLERACRKRKLDFQILTLN